ncbi:MAG: hypothetical protein ABWY16_19460 [Pedobacter sp.]|jgi:hypothetical protein
MDKRSFNLLFTLVAASMVVIGTYKLAKKKSHTPASHVSAATAKTNK